MTKYRLKNIEPELFKRALHYSARHKELPRHQMLQKLTILDFVVPLLPAKRDSQILEIGAGLGIHSALLSHHGRVSSTELQIPGSFVGADREVRKIRAELFDELGGGPIEFSFHDGRRLPYADGSFDVVFHNSVIEHVPDVLAFNAEVHRVLKPGGLCICITGTPTLCWFRFIKHCVLRVPVLLCIVAAKETLPARWVLKIVRGIARAARLSEAITGKVLDRLTRVDQRLDSVAPSPDNASQSASDVDVRALYSRLYHFLYFPNYNQVVIEKAAKDLGTTSDELLSAAKDHFRHAKRRIAFDLTPATHGQHYHSVWHEMREWRLDRWRNQFAAANLHVEQIVGYRYHHLLEVTPSDQLNASLYYLAAPRVRACITNRSNSPQHASEIIIAARRSA